MTTNFETRRELVVSKRLVVPVVPNLASVSNATPGAIVYDSSTGNLNVASGGAWTPSVLTPATPTTLGTVYGITNLATSGGKVCLGYESSEDTSGGIFIGYRAGFLLPGTAIQNTAIGFQALNVAFPSQSCVAIGSNAGQIQGDENVSVGVQSGQAAIGDNNVFFGYNAGVSFVGSGNTVFGTQASDGGFTGPANNNVIIGFQAGRTGTTASGNIVIGSSSSPDLGTCTNCIVIGTGASCQTAGTNRIVLGASAVGTTNNEFTISPTITQWRSFGLSSAAAANTLQIDPATGIITQAASSRRFKENIRELEVDTRKVHQLSLRSYNYKSDGKEDYGLIAEDTYEILPEIVTLDSEGKPHGIRHLTLVMLLLAEIQRLREELESLQ